MSRRTAPGQMFLFEEPAAAAPPFSPAVAGQACFETCLREFLEELLRPGKTGGPCLLDQAFAFAELRSRPTDEDGDALTTHLLGFAPSDLPRFTNNLCKTLGDIFEKLVHIVYRSAYPDLYSTNFTALEDQVEDLRKTLRKGEKIGKWKPDFLIGVIAHEIKYRCGNGQGSTEQGWGALTLKRLRYTARMLFFRMSPNAARYDRKGWECLEADAAIARIEKDTGIDMVEIIRQARQDARVAVRRRLGYQELMRRELSGISFRLEMYGEQMRNAAPSATIRTQEALQALSSKDLSARRS